MTESKKLADFLGLHHTEIFFNQEFTSQLPELIDNTAFLSSGFNHIGRSSLLYTYSTLRERYDFDKIITGIFIDGNFRGHAHSPAFVSENLKKYFADNRFIEGKLGFNYYRPLLADSAHEYLLHMFNKLNNELGGLQTGEHHLLLHLYKGAPNIFAQEYKIADQFTTLRSPGFDNTLIELAFSIKESTLNFSQYMPGHRRGTHKEMILQAYILKKSNKLLARFPVRHASPEAVLHGKFYYLLNKYGNYFLYRMKNTGKNYIPLEDNNHWMNILYKDSIDRFVFNKNSFIHEFFSENFLSHLKEKRETHILMKIATVELLMNLLNNGWVSSKYISR
ncbi:MAG: hypothetical protein ACP5D1_06275 [Bacteroidales bacterium]